MSDDKKVPITFTTSIYIPLEQYSNLGLDGVMDEVEIKINELGWCYCIGEGKRNGLSKV